MTLYRRGTVYFCLFGAGRGFAYDDATGLCTGDVDPAGYFAGAGSDGRDWPPVPETEPIPDGLRARLILPLPAARDTERE